MRSMARDLGDRRQGVVRQGMVKEIPVSGVYSGGAGGRNPGVGVEVGVGSAVRCALRGG